MKTHIRTVRATARLWARMATVPLRLALWAVPERLAGAARAFTPARAARVAVVALAVATPAALLMREHARAEQYRRALRDLAFSSGAEVATLRRTMGRLLDEQAQLRDLLLDAGYAVYSDGEFAVVLAATGYSSSVRETDDSPHITASNTHTRTGIVAMSRDLLRRYNPEAPFAFGDVVHISGLGDFVVEDSMHPRWRRRVDVWFPSRREAMRFGRRRVLVRSRGHVAALGDEFARGLALAASSPGRPAGGP